MAFSTPIFSPFSLLLIILLSSATAMTAASTDLSPANTTHLHFYFHEIFEGSPNATSFIVASGPANFSSGFGNIRVYDNALRQGPEPNSTLIGRAQGITVSTSLTDLATLTTMNLVFTEGKYNGSSLALTGRVDPTFFADRSIVGGSGQFRLARGYALSNLTQIISPLYIVVEFDVYVMQAST